MTSQRIDRLLRSLVGVADVRMHWHAQTLRGVHILRDDRATPQQLTRNIVSGLRAAFGVDVQPEHVYVHEQRELFDAVVVASEMLEAPAPAPAPADDAKAAGGHGAGNGIREAHAPEDVGSRGRDARVRDVVRPTGNGSHGNGAHGNGNGNGHGKAGGYIVRGEVRESVIRRDVHDDAPIDLTPVSQDVLAMATELVRVRREMDEDTGLRLERIDVDRRGPLVRCRTVLAHGGQLYSAIAEAPDGATAEAELAARVAVDALRAGGLTTALLDGVGFITVSKTNWCLATVREAGMPAPRAGAAPLLDSMAASATAAVLMALGSFTDARAKGARAKQSRTER